MHDLNEVAPEDLADGFVVVDEDGSWQDEDDDGPDYRDAGYGPDDPASFDPEDDGPGSLFVSPSLVTVPETDEDGPVLLPAIGSPSPDGLTVPDDDPERVAVLASIRDARTARVLADAIRAAWSSPSVGPWHPVPDGATVPDGPRFSGDTDDPASLPVGPPVPETVGRVMVNRSVLRVPRSRAVRSGWVRVGRRPSRSEMLAASRLRDRGAAPGRRAASLGLPSSFAATLAALPVADASRVLRDAVDALPKDDRDRARTVPAVSLDWAGVAPWEDVNGTHSPEDPGRETVPASLFGAVSGSAPVVLVRPLDGPGTLAMLAMSPARVLPALRSRVDRLRSPRTVRTDRLYVGSSANYRPTDRAGTGRGARVGSEGSAPVLVGWAIRSRSALPVARTAPVAVEVAPRVMAARRPFPRMDRGRVVWREDGTHDRTRKDGTTRTVSHKSGATVPSVLRKLCPVVPGWGRLDPARMIVVPSVVPERERETARMASVLRGPGTTVGRYGETVGADPLPTDRIVPRKDGTLRRAPRVGSGAGTRGGRRNK